MNLATQQATPFDLNAHLRAAVVPLAQVLQQIKVKASVANKTLAGNFDQIERSLADLNDQYRTATINGTMPVAVWFGHATAVAAAIISTADAFKAAGFDDGTIAAQARAAQANVTRLSAAVPGHSPAGIMMAVGVLGILGFAAFTYNAMVKDAKKLSSRDERFDEEDEIDFESQLHGKGVDDVDPDNEDEEEDDVEDEEEDEDTEEEE